MNNDWLPMNNGVMHYRANGDYYLIRNPAISGYELMKGSETLASYPRSGSDRARKLASKKLKGPQFR